MTEAATSSRPGGFPISAIVKRALVILVAGAALYGLAPKLGEVLGAWPHLRDIRFGWFAAMAVSQAASIVCMAAVQRIAVETDRWAPVIDSYLAGNAVSKVVPGGAATAAALQYAMLVEEGVPAGRAATGMTAGSVIVFGALLGLNVLALPLLLLGVNVPSSLLAAAWISAALLAAIGVLGAFAFGGDGLLRAAGRAGQWVRNRVRRNAEPLEDLPERLIAERDDLLMALGERWWQALLAAAGKWVFDYITLLAALAAVGQHPNAALVLVAYSAAALLGQIPITPGGLGVVEAGLTGSLALIGVNGGAAVVATLAYRLFSYWLQLPAGAVAWALHRRALRAKSSHAGDPREPALPG
ncbi:MAG: YbhN family protein [Thermoleophilaceae bacterium]